MDRKLKQRITIQAALCVEELLEAAATEGARPWVCVVEKHMKSLFTPPEFKMNPNRKNRRRK